MIDAIRQLVAQAERFGVALCADMDEDCAQVQDPYACWIFEENTGFCPYCARVNVLLSGRTE